ncbi:unnamed protein product [Cylicocyclus nassatus]|uniref:Transmembrane protein 144 n=1 Tax=Cylicocyclus nassatus TaxID=53992 RepID=A0AA36LYR3_CYLNA|nr:unnamed protein product [Cylicocyclus nassatus]
MVGWRRGMSIGVGLAACGVSSVFFGSMFVPIRKYNAADGMFAQWVMSAAILFIGFLVFCIQGFPGFYPLAMLGGMLWTIGNATAIPIISRLGMALGILIWNTTNCLTGWAGGRFGLFGMKPNPPASDILNYGGLVLVIIGGILFSQVKGSSTDEDKNEKEKHNLDLVRVEEVESEEKEPLNEPEKEVEEEVSKAKNEKESLHDGKQRIIGIAMSLIAGVFYGMTFVPVIYMMDNPKTFPEYPMDSLSYVFSHYFGIFLTATTLFIGYAMIKRNQPIIPQPIFLPAFLSGLLWAIAQTSFFIANQHLSQAVTFPIITMLPGCIASAWSILYFREIKGRRNLTILAIAMSITLTGAMLFPILQHLAEATYFRTSRLSRVSAIAHFSEGQPWGVARYNRGSYREEREKSYEATLLAMSLDLWIGLTAAVAASVLFGTVFVPIKKVACGDGFATQLFVCIGAFLGGAVVNGILKFPPLYGFAMIGGALWCIANAFAIQIMNRLGMALSILVWNTLSCLTGWATSRYGLFGLPAAIPASLALNYLGITVLIAGGVAYLFVKSNTKVAVDMEKDEKSYAANTDSKGERDVSFMERAVCFGCAMISGVFYGSMWLPISYIKTHLNEFPNAPEQSISYLFSFFCGVLCTSICVFIIYSLIRRNSPYINPETAVPCMLGGAIFATAMSAFVVAIDNLDQAIAYPICSMAPGVVVSSWSIFYFREITGRKNLTRLAVAYLLTLIGVILVTISKEVRLF